MADPRITIVGASLAGLRTAEAVLAELPQARIMLVGDEPHAPYNRPPLSKDSMEALAGGQAPRAEVFEKLLLRSKIAPGQIEMRLGVAASGIENGDVRLEDGALIPSDFVVAATGIRPRRMPMQGAADRQHVLRSFDDAEALAQAMRPGAQMVVIGAGFIGCEIAATARKLGLHVTVVEPAPQPMLRALGHRVAAAMAALHRRNGVTLLTGRSVETFEVDRVILDDGKALEADVIVEALGSRPNTEWLAASGADLSDGVLVDADMVAIGAPNLLAVGDIARFANPLFDEVPRRVEHWCVPGQTAKRAAATIAARVSGGAPAPDFAPMPSFWSDQYGMRVQAFGAPALAETQTVVEGDLTQIGEAPIVVEYARGDHLVGVIGLGAPPALIARYRARLMDALRAPVTA
ncbi:NAD(P)/FAD-dependent oxidoreductase [Sedimentimonas flavescens]|uniref:NAD(P)/FAD-dependent oxidoreductase n=1 Tax=Sedimentimonas flavescens TaxID=2851012 RepID=UPI0021A2862D|nr:FAD-dependent oxidoreductase [Sedimentimonas flavescens]MCT2541242.1 FAD-dependent oxidoreductase [Sedimentimonas flavescens]